jgi:hypothetical protein
MPSRWMIVPIRRAWDEVSRLARQFTLNLSSPAPGFSKGPEVGRDLLRRLPKKSVSTCNAEPSRFT